MEVPSRPAEQRQVSRRGPPRLPGRSNRLYGVLGAPRHVAPAPSFGRLDVSCEGYDRPGDSYVLRGSCGLRYTLTPSGSSPGLRPDNWSSRDGAYGDDEYDGSPAGSLVPDPVNSLLAVVAVTMMCLITLKVIGAVVNP